MCPVCTVTVVAGLGISRLLGIDDLITSIWIGAFILSFSFITIDWLKKKGWFGNPNNLTIQHYNTYALIALMYVLVIVPLKLDGSIGIPGNTLWGVDKILLGTLIGSVIFLMGAWADKHQRKKFTKIFFPYQKVVFPVVALLIISSVFYFVL